MRNAFKGLRRCRNVVFLLIIMCAVLSRSLLTTKPSIGQPFLSPSLREGSSPLYTGNVRIGVNRLLEDSDHLRRRNFCLYGLDLFGLGAPEIVICGLAVAVLYGPDRIKGQLKDNGVKGQIVAEGWREEHNERVADLKKYAVQSRKKRAWKKINLAIENEDPVLLAKLAEIDAKNPDSAKKLPAYEDEDDEDDDDDDDINDDDEVLV
jgi:hypothetical protein